MDVDPTVEEEFNDWYNTDHLPALGGVAEVCNRRDAISSSARPRAVVGNTWLCMSWVKKAYMAQRPGRRPLTRPGRGKCCLILRTGSCNSGGVCFEYEATYRTWCSRILFS